MLVSWHASDQLQETNMLNPHDMMSSGPSLHKGNPCLGDWGSVLLAPYVLFFVKPAALNNQHFGIQLSGSHMGTN